MADKLYIKQFIAKNVLKQYSKDTELKLNFFYYKLQFLNTNTLNTRKKIYIIIP